MSKYIKAKDLLNEVYAETVEGRIFDGNTYVGTFNVVPIDDITEIVNHMPSANVVEVVLCKDCKYHQSDDEMNFNYCKFHGVYINTDFCADGERKETE